MNFQFNEDDLEQVALEWLQSLGYDYKKGNEISMTSLTPERKSDKDVVLHERLEKALRKINSDMVLTPLNGNLIKTLCSRLLILCILQEISSLVFVEFDYYYSF